MSEKNEKKVIKNEMTNAIIDAEKTRDSIRVVYQKMSAFMDAAVDELCFGNDEFVFLKYDKVYKDMRDTLHQSMLDIPIEIYDGLNAIVENDLYLYMYGIPEADVEVWDLSEFCDLCNELNSLMDEDASKMAFMKKKSEKFYQNIRAILKDYLLG